MNRLIACAALLLAPPASAASINAPAMDRLLAAAGFTGEAIVGRGDAIVYHATPGLAAPGRPHMVGERWRWASVTKQIVALIVMQEVAAGRIDLDAPVAAYWPGWRAPHAGTITIRHLLRHQSGLADPNTDPADADGLPVFYRATGPAADPDAHAAGYCADRPRAAPPAPFRYNNCDYLVIGRVLRAVTGQDLAALIESRIARPLGLTDIGLFRWDRREPRGVSAHDARGRAEPPVNLGIYGAAGGLYGSAESLWRIDRALLRGELLDPAATATMWAGEPALGHAALGAWSFAAPLNGCPAPVRLIERRGEIGGVRIRNILLPDTGTALILFTNRVGFGFGDLARRTGLVPDLLAAIACPPPPRPSNGVASPS